MKKPRIHPSLVAKDGYGATDSRIKFQGSKRSKIQDQRATYDTANANP